MLYNLLYPLADQYSILNVFKYLTFRTGGAIITSLMISFIWGKDIIYWLKTKQKGGQPIYALGPQTHIEAKKGTPTMGGVLILLAVSMSTILWADINNPFVWIVLGVTMGFGTIGFWDDYMKLTKQSNRGISGTGRLCLEIIIAVTGIIASQYFIDHSLNNLLTFPFFKNVAVNLGWFFIPFAAFIIVGSANAVNLTDGLDGLAIVPIMIAAGCFALISYIVGHIEFSQYLKISYIPGVGELAVFLGALVGAALGFLWYNAPPAMIFMGDTGSLSSGAALGTISIITKHEIVLGIVGGLFVLETLSVVIQVLSFKLTGKRIFRMAPLHHHFEQKGWAEATVVIRFWIIAIILGLIGLSTLKLR